MSVKGSSGALYVKAGIGKKNVELEADAIQKSQLVDFANSLKVGDIVIATRKRRRMVVEKHPYFCVTDKGCYTWIDMYMFSKGLKPGVDEYRYKSIRDDDFGTEKEGTIPYGYLRKAI